MCTTIYSVDISLIILYVPQVGSLFVRNIKQLSNSRALSEAIPELVSSIITGIFRILSSYRLYMKNLPAHKVATAEGSTREVVGRHQRDPRWLMQLIQVIRQRREQQGLSLFGRWNSAGRSTTSWRIPCGTMNVIACRRQ